MRVLSTFFPTPFKIIECAATKKNPKKKEVGIGEYAEKWTTIIKIWNVNWTYLTGLHNTIFVDAYSYYVEESCKEYYQQK